MDRCVVPLVLLLALARGAGADPRHWTHDLPLTFGPERKGHPHVTSLEGNGGFGIFVAWEQETAAGDSDIYLLASFDGCNWCGPVLWATGPGDETRPWIGAGTTHTLEIALQLVFERGGQVWVAGDFSIPFTPDPAALCSRFAALATPAPRLLSPDPLAIDSHPRIAVVGRWLAFSQFHAVWQSRRATGPPSLLYDHDLDQDGTGWGLDLVDLTARTSEAGRNPAITGDLVATVDSAATVAYESEAGEVRMLRSADRGFTWDPPVTVSGASARVHPAVDSDTHPFATGQPAWNGFGWQGGAIPQQVSFDAARFTSPVVRDPDFDPAAGDLAASGAGTTPAPEASLSVWPRTGGPSAAFLFWTDDRPGEPSEIVARAGVLDAASPGRPRDLDVYPLAPVRLAPPDPLLSTVHPLSSCAWRDGWPGMDDGACTPLVRAGGSGAVQVASRDTFGFTFSALLAAFLDDRSGTPQVFFKMTDLAVAAPSFDPAALPTFACTAPGEIEATVRFHPLSECPAASSGRPERIDRYLVYAGRDAAGPYPTRVEVANAGLTDPQPLAIGGLAPGETYILTLLAEDQARNIRPADFDPRAATNGGFDPAQQLTLTAPVNPCQPSVSVSCRILEESCAADGRPADGVFEPGEQITLEIVFTNSGDLGAEELEAAVTATNAAVLDPTVSIPTVDAGGGSAMFAVRLRIDPAIPCGSATAVDVDLAGLRTRWGALSPAFDPLAACDLTTSGPGDPCLACAPPCVAAVLPPVHPVFAVRAGVGRTDVDLDWTGGADPGTESYNTWRVTGAMEKARIPLARDGGPWPAVSGCLRSAATTCSDPGAVTGDGGSLEFYQVRGVCGSSEAPE